MGKTGQRTDPDRVFFIISYAAHRVDAVDAHQFSAGALSFPDLHQHVASAGDDLRLRMLLQQSDRVLNALRLIQCLNIVHNDSSLKSARLP